MSNYIFNVERQRQFADDRVTMHRHILIQAESVEAAWPKFIAYYFAWTDFSQFPAIFLSSLDKVSQMLSSEQEITRYVADHEHWLQDPQGQPPQAADYDLDGMASFDEYKALLEVGFREVGTIDSKNHVHIGDSDEESPNNIAIVKQPIEVTDAELIGIRKVVEMHS